MPFIPPVSVDAPFVYFDTLAEIPETSPVWDNAVRMISQFNSASVATANDRQMDAVHFLRKVADFQRKGEIAFVENYKQKLEKQYKETPDEKIKSDLDKLSALLDDLSFNKGFDYYTFVAALNIVTKDSENLKSRLSTLLQNVSRKNSQKYKERDLLEGGLEEFQNIAELLRNERARLKKEEDDYENIVAHFFAKYIKDNESILQQSLLDDTLFSSWILNMNIKFRMFMEKERTKFDFPRLRDNYETKRKYWQRKFNQFTEENNLLNFSEENMKILKSIASNMEFQKISDLANDNRRATFTLPTLRRSSWRRSNSSVAFTSNFSAPALSERLNILATNFLDVFLQTGGSNMGDDSLGAVLFHYDPLNHQAEINEIDETLKKLDAAFTEFSNIRTDRAKVLEGNAEMNRKIEKALIDLNNYLAENDKDAKAFIIHDSDKYYHSIEQGHEGAYHKGEGVVGGFGGRTMSILNYIDTMSNLSIDFGIDNRNLLYFVALNLGSHTAGANSMAKATLEEIFTYAAGMIMFDDVAIAVKEATNQLEFSNITNIHLYQLQNLFFPSSYILEQTANYLEGCQYDSGNAAIAKIEIGENIYAPAYQNLYEENTEQHKTVQNNLNRFLTLNSEEKWNTVRNYASAQTKVSIHFFLHFQEFISHIPH